MDSSTIAHDLRAREWRQIILEANNSDIPKSQYIREHHLSENSFYYWQRLFRKEAVAEKTDLPSVSSSLTAAFEKTAATGLQNSSFIEVSVPSVQASFTDRCYHRVKMTPISIGIKLRPCKPTRCMIVSIGYASRAI